MITAANEPQGLAVLSRDGRIVHWDDAAQRLLGWAPAQVVGRDFIDTLVAPGHREVFRREAMEAAAAQGCPVIGRRWAAPLLTPSGEAVRTSWAVVPRPVWASQVEFCLGRLDGELKP